MTTGTEPDAPAKTATVDVVVPVFNEERSLPGCLRVLDEFLSRHFPFRTTITVVDNASTDGTLDVALSLSADFERVRVVHLDRKGRGLALREAWGASDAAVVDYMDVDLSTGLDALLPLVAPLVNGHSDLSIGSRLAPGARTFRGPKREFVSRAYNQLIHLMHGARFSDAQCGFNAARTDVVRPLLVTSGTTHGSSTPSYCCLPSTTGCGCTRCRWTGSRTPTAGSTWSVPHGTTYVDSSGWRGRRRRGRRGWPIYRGGPSRAAHPDAVLGRRGGGLSWQLVSSTLVGPHTSTGRTRVHVQGLVVFGLYYLFTSAALLLLHAFAATPSRLLELSVLLVSSGLGTAGRFLLLRRWIFKPGKDN
jgi:hypothetical protein